MRSVEMVDIRDVYPWEDNGVVMNPRDFSTPESRQYVEALAEQFRTNRSDPGQPRTMPILLRDGGIYWIVDGECRYRAMKLAGTKKFWANVYDDAGEAETARREAARTMVETDTKLRLSQTEVSRGVQTMLALDVSDDDVAASARIEVEKVRRARRGARRVGDAAYDMTLDRLLAVDEFADDPEAVEALSTCDRKEWQGVYQKLQRAREAEECKARILQLFSEAGSVERDCVKDDGWTIYGSFYFGQYGVELAERHVASHPDMSGTCHALSDYGVVLFTPAAPREQAEPDPDAELRAAYEADAGRRLAWVAERLDNPLEMRAAAEFLQRLALDGIAGSYLATSTGRELPRTLTSLSCAAVLDRRAGMPEWWAVARGTVDPDRAHLYVGLMEAMEHDGYELSEAERRAVEASRLAMGGESDER